MANKNIDWTQAPEDAEWWEINEMCKKPIWCKDGIIDVTTINDPIQELQETSIFVGYAPLFGYEGTIEDSITYRPKSV